MAFACSIASWRIILKVDFYQLAGSSVENVLPRIAERILGDAGRLLVVCEDDPLAGRLDACLWNYRPESFLPHGRTGQGDEARQPILIAEGVGALNGARNIALADGIWRDEALDFERAFLFFADDRIAEAREAWRDLGNRDDIERRFWKQDDAGRWTQAA